MVDAAVSKTVEPKARAGSSPAPGTRITHCFTHCASLLSDATVTKGHVQGYAIAVASRTRGPSVRLVISGPEGGKWVRPTPAVFAELVASAVDEILFLSYALRHGDSAVDLLLEACARGVTVRVV